MAHGLSVVRPDPSLPTEGAVELLVGSLGALGMTLFFVLSGFVIHLNYRQTAGLRQGGTARFLIARFARLYPLYLLVFAYAFLRLLWASGYFEGHLLTDFNPWKALPLYMTFTDTFWIWPLGPHSAYTYYETPFTAVTGVMWSLSTEWFFYMAYPLFATAAARLVGYRLWVACGIVAVGCIAFFHAVQTNAAALTAWSAANFPQVPGDEFPHWLIYNSPYGRIFEFLLGVLGAQAYLTTQPRRKTVCFLTYGAAITFVGCYFYGYSGTGTALAGWPMSYYAPLIAVLIYGLMWRETRLSAFFGSALLVAGGQASYSLYLLHIFVLDYFRDFGLARPGLPKIVPYLLAIATAIVVARVMYLIFERHATRFVRTNFIAYGMHIGVPIALALITVMSLFLSYQMLALQVAAGHPAKLVW
jgi:peptidoglycan/LPS O-acetylase OafA/YrhL